MLVAEGITKEQALTAPLREAADLVVDTSDLPLPALRQLVLPVDLHRRVVLSERIRAPRKLQLHMLTPPFPHCRPNPPAAHRPVR